MNKETAIRIQAYSDNSLPPKERSEVESLLQQDGEARDLCDNLGRIKTVIASNEIKEILPETREFFWSQLEREIRKTPLPQRSRNKWFRLGWLVPIAAVIAVAILRFPSKSTLNLDLPGDLLANAVDENEAITFYSPEAKMNVVWVDFRGDTQ